MKTKAFKAFGTKGSVTASTAKDAALAFFDEYPSAKKCDIREGYLEGGFFVMVFGKDAGFRADGITKKTINTL